MPRDMISVIQTQDQINNTPHVVGRGQKEKLTAQDLKSWGSNFYGTPSPPWLKSAENRSNSFVFWLGFFPNSFISSAVTTAIPLNDNCMYGQPAALHLSYDDDDDGARQWNCMYSTVVGVLEGGVGGVSGVVVVAAVILLLPSYRGRYRG